MPDLSFRAYSTVFHFTLRLKCILFLSFFSHWRKTEECVFHVEGKTIVAHTLRNLIEIASTDNVDNTTF